MNKFYKFGLMALFFGSSLAVNGQLTITGSDSPYCIYNDADTLHGVPAGGYFTGPGMTDSIFDPSAAGSGVHSIEYHGNAYYLRSNVGEPWGNTENPDAMDDVFGAGNWTLGFFEIVDPAIVFSGGTDVVFIDGSDDNAVELEAFLTANMTTIEDWVFNGGHLLLNSAPNEDDGMSFGFDGTTLNYSDPSSSVTVVDAAHPIAVGPFTPLSMSMTGGSYSHSSISGTGYTNLIVDAGTPSKVVLAEKTWGDGIVMVGGMTTPNFHSPTTEARNIRRNMLDYLMQGSATSIEIVVSDPSVIANIVEDTVCYNAEATVFGSGAESYVWDPLVTDNVPFTATTAGTTEYMVIGTDTIGCVDTAYVDLFVRDEIIISGTVTDESGTADGAIDITVTGGTGTSFNFDWDNDGTGDFDDSEDLTGLIGAYYTVVVEDSVGCTATETFGVNNPLGINEEGAIAYQIFPNPSNGLVTIQLFEINNVSIVVTDLSGKIILTENNINGQVEMDLTTLESGVYLFNIVSENEQYITKVMKR